MSVFGGHIPLDYLMVGGIGFLAAWLLAFMVMPAVHHRAVRLTRRHVDLLPLSVQEMRAEKDTIRASFAAATRQLEMNIAQLREKTAAHATDLAKKVQLIARLKQELGAVDAALKESEARELSARTELRDIKRELAGKDMALSAAELEIAKIKAEIAALTPALVQAERPAGWQTERHADRHLQRPAEDTVQQTADVVTLAPLRAPLDVVPAPNRLLPPSPSPAQHRQQHDDNVMRAWTEIRDAARQVDARYEGVPFGRRPNGAAVKPVR